MYIYCGEIYGIHPYISGLKPDPFVTNRWLKMKRIIMSRRLGEAFSEQLLI